MPDPRQGGLHQLAQMQRGVLDPGPGEEYVVNAVGMPQRSFSEMGSRGYPSPRRRKLMLQDGLRAGAQAVRAGGVEAGIHPDDSNGRRQFEMASLEHMFPDGIPQDIGREYDARWEGWADPGTFSAWLEGLSDTRGPRERR